MKRHSERAGGLLAIDGALISNWSRELFAEMREGGVSAANCTISVWENFTETMRNLVRFNRLFDENSDLIRQVASAAEIERAHADGRSGIILGFQNVSAFEDQLGYVELFR